MTSKAMLGNMEAMFGHVGGGFIPVPFEPSLGYVYDVQVPISQTRPLDSDF